GIPKPVDSQPLYNIVNRQAEPEQIHAAAHHGLGIVPFSPQARGVLSGKYAPGAAPQAGTRAGRQDKRILETVWRPESLAIARKVQAYAQDKGVLMVEFDIACVLNNQL
ncbi:aldo/keto reductase, partial [Pseudomonas sp. BJa5]|uniref:aldo/keto reductase n=1 Tax=Pseudomonas sp. BJa5 TaxID=2936270 RepID=UPI0025595ADA